MDISPEMIEYCRARYLCSNGDRSNGDHSNGDRSNGDHSANEKISSATKYDFEVADAGDPASMKASWSCQFDLLVSFLTMHWVSDQRKVLQNIGFCLKPGGLALILMGYKHKAFIGSEY